MITLAFEKTKAEQYEIVALRNGEVVLSHTYAATPIRHLPKDVLARDLAMKRNAAIHQVVSALLEKFPGEF